MFGMLTAPHFHLWKPSVTVSGQDKAGNVYAGTDSITFTLDTSAPSVVLTDTDADNIISTTLSPTQTVTITVAFSRVNRPFYILQE